MLSYQEGQDKINRIKQELESPANIEVWRAKFDDDTYGDRLGIVYKPSDSKLQFNYVVCEVANIGTIEKDGDIELDVDDERTRQLRLIVSAPDMLRSIRRAIVDLEAVTGLHKPDAECGTWIVGKGHETEKLWQKLIDIQDYLERMEYDATDTESL
jgi:hypothetical protein